MDKFKLFGTELVISPTQKYYNELREEFFSEAEDRADEYMETYSEYRNLDTFAEDGLSDGNELINEVLDIAIEKLIENNIFDIDRETFTVKYYAPYYYSWADDFESVNEKYMEIVSDQQQMDAYRTARREHRGKWVGGGFGIGGAIKGAAKAGVLNAASGLAHGTVNIIGKGFSTLAAISQKDKVYSSSKNKKRLKKGIFNSCFAVHKALVDVLAERISKSFNVYTEDDAQKVKIYLGNIEKSSFPKDKIVNVLFESFQLYPYNDELYIYILRNYPHETKNIIELASYFDVDIDDYMLEMVEVLTKKHLKFEDNVTLKSMLTARQSFISDVELMGLNDYDDAEEAIENILNKLDKLIHEKKESDFKSFYKSLTVTTVDEGISAISQLEKYSSKLGLEDNNATVEKIADELEKKIIQFRTENLKTYYCNLDISTPALAETAIQDIVKYCEENNIDEEFDERKKIIAEIEKKESSAFDGRIKE
jgi:hypothetical protein